MKNSKLLNELSSLFLSYRDLDEAYCRILEEIKELYDKGVVIDIRDIQDFAYKRKEIAK